MESIKCCLLGRQVQDTNLLAEFQLCLQTAAKLLQDRRTLGCSFVLSSFITVEDQLHAELSKQQIVHCYQQPASWQITLTSHRLRAQMVFSHNQPSMTGNNAPCSRHVNRIYPTAAAGLSTGYIWQLQQACQQDTSDSCSRPLNRIPLTATVSYQMNHFFLH